MGDEFKANDNIQWVFLFEKTAANQRDILVSWCLSRAPPNGRVWYKVF